MDDDHRKGDNPNRGREGDRQIKEGAIRPVDNPKGPPPSKVEVSPADPGSDADSSDSSSGDSGGTSSGGGGEE